MFGVYKRIQLLDPQFPDNGIACKKKKLADLMNLLFMKTLLF